MQATSAIRTKGCFAAVFAILLFSVALLYHRTSVGIPLVFSYPRITARLESRAWLPFGRLLVIPTPQSPGFNGSEMACKFPKLLADDPSLKPFLKTHPPLKCSPMKNWIYTRAGAVYYDKSVAFRYGTPSCTIRDVFFKDDMHWDFTKPRKFVDSEKLKVEAYIVNCTGSSGGRYQDLQVGVPQKPELMSKPKRNGSVATEPNILIYLMDSMSRINSVRKMPLVYNALQRDMGAAIMEGFNTVGDGTPWTLIPMLTGHFQPELYEARKRFSNSSTVDNWPLLFHELTNEGYVTAYAEEQPQFSFFSYKLKGFAKPPVDYYLRPFEQAVNYVRSHHRPYCLGDTPRSLVLNRWWKDYQDTFRPLNIKTFALLFSSETSHDDYNLVQTMDPHWKDEFLAQFHAGYFNDTFLIVMGDHGRRFGPVRKTQSGKLEEKLPFLAILPPPSFRIEYPTCYENLRTNQHRLMTPFDLYETLRVITLGEVNDADCAAPANISSRGVSLFNEIPPERDCHHAAIKPHFCSCLQWDDVASDSEAVKGVLDAVLKKFNEALAPAGSQCAKLELASVLWAKRFEPSVDILKFAQSKDYDNIYPDMSSKDTVPHNVMYQVRFVTSPNEGEYEASVSHFIEQKAYVVNLDDVSRLNSYSDQPHCIMDSHQELRAYCICADKVGVAKSSLLDSRIST